MGIGRESRANKLLFLKINTHSEIVFFKVTDKDHTIKDILSNTVVVCFVKTDNRPQMESLILSPTLPD